MAENDMRDWWEERSTPEKVATVVFLAILGAGALFLFGLVVMWLWNWLMPEIFGLQELSYWQAWGLLLLSSILFKNIDFGSDDGKSRRAERKRKQKLREYMQGQKMDPDADSVTPGEPSQEDSLAEPPHENPQPGDGE